MTTMRAYSWTLKTAAILLGAQAALCMPQDVYAASAAGEAVVRVMSRPTSIGTLSIFTVNIANPQQSTRTINASPQTRNSAVRQSTPATADRIQPAIFSISGLPNQTFAIVIPTSGTSSSANGSVQFLNFTHSAGGTPVIGGNGSTVFAVGARVQFTPAADQTQSQGQNQDQSQDHTQDQTQGKPQTKPKAVIPKRNPFGILGIEDGYMSVLISYN